MNGIENWLFQHADHAHWIAFFAVLLAGMNIPISIDLVLIICAYIAATILPDHAVHLFFAILIGCCLSAWIAYWMGRTVGRRLITLPLLSKSFPEARIEKWRTFYEKNGFWTLLFGRFIPFGVRNILFLSTGMSKMNFPRFAFRDAIACTIWVSTLFSAIYFLGLNLETIRSHFAAFRYALLLLLPVTGIAFLWYKRKKKAKKDLL